MQGFSALISTKINGHCVAKTVHEKQKKMKICVILNIPFIIFYKMHLYTARRRLSITVSFMGY